MSTATLQAEAKENTGKGTARALRREGKVPAIIYGGGGDQAMISLDCNELTTEIHHGSFTSRVVELKLDKETIRVLPRDVQYHPVTDVPEHVDFLRVTKDSKVRVFVKVNFHNHEKSPGIKRGGVLNVVRHSIEFICSPDSIPQSIDVDLTGLSIGDSVHVESVTLPEGITPVIERNFTIATIVGRLAKEEDIAPTPAAEGEEGAEAAEGEAPAEGAEGAAEGGEGKEEAKEE